MRYNFEEDRIKKRAKFRPANDYQIKCIFPKRGQAEEYRNWEANKSPALRRLFNVQERLILYLKYTYGYGYARIRHMSGISERKVRKTIYRAYAMAKYESQGYPQNESNLDFQYKIEK